MSCALRYAALLIPQFRLQAVLAQPDTGASPKAVRSVKAVKSSRTATAGSLSFLNQAMALVDPQSPKSLILETSPLAEGSGVAPGMTGSQALAREPRLHLLNASASDENRLCERLLRFCHTLCPRVEKRAPALWMLDLRGLCITDWMRWAREALDTLRQNEGVHAFLGLAPRPALALCAARKANPIRLVEEPGSFLEDLPLEELEVSGALLEKLHDWGIRFLGELLRLPRQAALERLGPEAAVLWEIARDTRESVLRLEEFEEVFAAEHDFEQPLETVSPLLFSLNRMVEQLCSRLRLLERMASGMRLGLILEDGRIHEHGFTIPAPNREEAVLLRILQTHLETLQFDSAVGGIRLRLEATLPTARQLALFESPLRDPNRFGETLARLRALAGENAVGVPLPTNSHRAEAFRLEDPLLVFAHPQNGPNTPTTLSFPDSHLPAGASRMHGTTIGLPLRRFRPALPAQVRLRAHQPVHVSATGLDAPVLEIRGPYRLCGDWWDPTCWNQEQWDVSLGGRAAGLYRIGCHFHGDGKERSWWVEGCYDGGWGPSQRARVPPAMRSTPTIRSNSTMRCPQEPGLCPSPREHSAPSTFLEDSGALDFPRP